ncbi:MAG TPA: C39 family peptidase [Micromonospora sp.]
MEFPFARAFVTRLAHVRLDSASLASVALLAIGGTLGGLLPDAPMTRVERPTIVAVASAVASRPPAELTLRYDFEYQPNFYYCGPASTRIALSAQGYTLDQDDLARRLGTTVNGTDSSHDIARVLNDVVGRDTYQVREIPGPTATPAEMDRLQADVVRSLTAGRVIVANIVGGATDNSGYWRDYPGGHYVTIVGYADEGRQVQVADPSGVGPHTYWISTIDMATWMAGRGYAH